MSEQITRLLRLVSNGDPDASDELVPLVYQQLRRLAQSHLRDADAREVDATEVVHEAYLRLLGDTPIAWSDRSHFFATAAQVIRRLLVDQARHRKAQKRGGDAEHVSLTIAGLVIKDRQIELLDLEEALGRLEALNPRQARVVELRFFGGLSQAEAAKLIGVSTRTAAGDWAMAKAWLKRELSADDPTE